MEPTSPRPAASPAPQMSLSFELRNCARKDELLDLDRDSLRDLNRLNNCPSCCREYGDEKSNYSPVMVSGATSLKPKREYYFQ